MSPLPNDLLSSPGRDAHNWHGIVRLVDDLSADFLFGLAARQVAAQYDPRADFGSLPELGGGAEGAIGVFKSQILPFLSASPGPRYLAYATGGATPAAVAGDWLAATVDQDVGSPGDSIATRVTMETLRWLLELFDLPTATFDGAFTTGATASNLLSIITAREWAASQSGQSAAEDGMLNCPPMPILSASAHVTFEKMLGVAGFGRRSILPVATLGKTQVMDVADLERKLGAAGGGPKMVVASAGTVTTTDFDDLTAVSTLCRKHKAWLHVDGAFGIFSRCSERFRHLTEGLDKADSITGDAHKWLNVPYECGFFFTRSVKYLEAACAASAVYLEPGVVEPELLVRGIESSQRFRALPTWMTLAAYGRQGVAEIVERCCEMARLLATHILSSQKFKLLCPVKLNVVCFCLLPGDGDDADLCNRTFLDNLNASGLVRMTPGSVGGARGVRAAFCNWRTAEDDISLVVMAMEKAALTTLKSLQESRKDTEDTGFQG